MSAGLKASVHPIVKDVEELIAAMKEEEERIKKLLITLAEATNRTKTLLFYESSGNSRADKNAARNRKFQLQKSVNKLRSVQASVIDAGVSTECPEYIEAMSVAKAVDEQIASINALEASLAKTVKRTRKWLRKHRNKPKNDIRKVKKTILKINGKIYDCREAGVSDQSPAIVGANEVLSELQSLMQATENLAQEKAAALTALRAAIVEAREGRLTEPLQAAVEAASKELGDDAAAVESIGKAKSLCSILLKEKELKEATEQRRKILSDLDASSEREEDREALKSSLAKLEDLLARALAEEDRPNALSVSLAVVAETKATIKEAQKTVAVMDAAANLRVLVQDAAQLWNIQTKEIVVGSGDPDDVRSQAKASMQLLEDELKAALTVGVFDQSSVVVDAQKTLSSWRDAADISEKRRKDQALRVTLATAFVHASESRQLAPLKEALASALASGASTEWQEVIAARELVAVVTKEHELAVGSACV